MKACFSFLAERDTRSPLPASLPIAKPDVHAASASSNWGQKMTRVRPSGNSMAWISKAGLFRSTKRVPRNFAAVAESVLAAGEAIPAAGLGAAADAIDTSCVQVAAECG